MGSTIVSSGDKIVCNNLQHVFVHGAYNLGPVLEFSDTGTDAIHPGEGVEHDKGAAGEDLVTLHTVRSATMYGIAEIDFLQIGSCATDYGVGDNIPIIPYHMNPGAYLRNIQCVDPTADIEPDQPLVISAATAGSFINLIELALQSSNTGTTEAITAAVVVGDPGFIFAGRKPLRNVQFITDTGAVHTVVAYIVGG